MSFPKTLVLLLLAILASQSILFAQSQTLYLPVLQATDAANLGLALSNPTLSATAVTLTARGPDGQRISGQGITNPATLIIPASGQRALQPVEIFGDGISGKTGWVEIVSPIPEVKGFFLVFDAGLNFIDGAELVSKPSNRLVFPNVSVARDSEININLINTGASRFLALVTLYDNSGNLVARNNLTIEPFSVLSGPVTDFVEAGTAFEGYAVVEGGSLFPSGNADSLVGFETYRNRSDIALLLAVPRSATLRTGFAAHLASQADYQTRLTLVNNSAREQSVDITADGLSVGGQPKTPASVTVQRTIPANGRLKERVDEMFGLSGSALIAGYIRFKVQGETQGLIGYVDYGTTDGTLLSAVPIQGSGGFSDLYFSHIAEGAGYYTGLAFVNPNAEPSSVTIDVFNREGSRVGSSAIVLAPGERRSRLVPELIPSLTTQLGGSVHVTASQPIFASQLFGSREGLTFLANVSAQGVQLQPQFSGDRVATDTGASVIAANGSASLAIPPGALRVNSSISLSTVRISTLLVPSATQKIIAAVDAQPSGTQFKIPAKLRFPLSAQFVPQTTLSLLLLNPSSNQFEPSGSTAIVDESGRTASADITHLSTYAIAIPSDRLINVSSISPTSGRPGTIVTIDGAGFSSIASEHLVTFAGKANTSIPATVAAATTISLTATVPAAAVTGDVIVSVGGRSSLGVPFRVIRDNPRPTVSNVSPARADYGATSVDIQISGTDFLTDSTVTYDGAVVSAAYLNSTLLRISVSDSQLNPGIHRIVVSNPNPAGAESNPIEFAVTSPMPAISSVSPNKGFRGTSTEVTITGSGFTPSSVVLLDGVAATGTFVNTTTMRVTALGLGSAVVILIAVSNPAPGGGTSNSAVFQVLEPAPGGGESPPPPPPPLPIPRISLITPNSGVTGTTVNVTLTGLFAAGAAVAVAGGGVTVSSVTFDPVDTTIMTANFTIDAGAATGTRCVTVTTADGTSPCATFTIINVATGQPLWSGILDPSRAMDWNATNPGVVGGIPARITVCVTRSPGVSAAQLNNDLATCPDNQVVQLTAGTYNLSTGLRITRSNVTLRGAGPDKTFLVFTDTDNCDGHQGLICVMGFSGCEDCSTAVVNWTGGYAQGTKVITVADSSRLRAGMHIMLSQSNDGSDTGGITVSDGFASIEGVCGAGEGPQVGHCQTQVVTVTAINGNQVTISPGVYATHIRASQSPRIWYTNSSGAQVPSTQVGIESLSINNTAGDANGVSSTIINFHNVTNSWSKNVRTLNGGRQHYEFWSATHIEIRDCYMYGTINATSQSYGISPWISSDLLIINNIFQHVTNPITAGLNSGGVFAYNYGTDNFYYKSDFLQTSFLGSHDAGSGFKLYEGNDGAQMLWDTFHGAGGNQDTVFRSYLNGWEPGKTQGTVPIAVWAFNRAHNFIGNVLGRPGYHSSYESSNANSNSIYNLGNSSWGGGSSDPLVASSIMRWGNYDVVNNAVRFAPAEVPTNGIAFVRGNPVPATQALPPSFFLTSKPSWWGTPWGNPAWPAIGPDVTGGNIAAGSGPASTLGGHVYKIPARLCFENTPRDGGDAWLLFNAANCYTK